MVVNVLVERVYRNRAILAKLASARMRLRLRRWLRHGLVSAESRAVVEALKWESKAAEQRSPRYQCSIGFIYSSGKGVARDYVEGAKWFRKAAEEGDVIGQLQLGDCYSLGRGVLLDYVEAYKWYNLAAAQGWAGADKKREIVSRQMVMNYLDGTAAAVAGFQEERRIGNRGINHALNCLQDLFSNPDAQGPVACAAFRLNNQHNEPHNEQASLRIRQQCVTLAQALLS